MSQLSHRRLALGALFLCLPAALHAQRPTPNAAAAAAAAEVVKAGYQKHEMRIPMRDGVHLFTAVYVPRDTTRTYPMLMTRTPYGVAPYGADAYRTSLGPSARYADERFIFVYQDVRGRNHSEGTFTEMTPHVPVKRGPRDVDESSDAYDTVEWLLKHVRHHNGRVGITGGSYPGFYTSASCIDAHPAIKACSPQAPITDIWQGDDLFHNGAFLLPHNFGFYQRFGRGPRTEVGPDPVFAPFTMGTPDGYQFYLSLGSLANVESRYFKGTQPLWTTLVDHPSYDAYWQARNLRPHLKGMKPAILTVGGWFDAEDLAGPLNTYRAIEAQSPGATNMIVMGPWVHGGWNRGDGDRVGNARFGAKTSEFYRDSVELPFFLHHLKDGPRPPLPDALMFETGSNEWRRYASWPPKNAVARTLYLHPGGVLAFEPPPAASGAEAYEEYVSDPARPVPFIEGIAPGMPREYMTADQRFASRRPDVITFQTAPLTEDVTIAGPVSPLLHVATSGTDADFVVKLIDVHPDSASDWPDDSSGFRVAGYQQLLRGEPFRGRYRRSFSAPVPFVANQPDSIAFAMPDVNHTFRKGHRIMVQIQSTWFPYIDRNPQTFVPNIFKAKDSDFRKTSMRVYHSAQRPTGIGVMVLPQGSSAMN